jgi:hypothetical protein
MQSYFIHKPIHAILLSSIPEKVSLLVTETPVYQIPAGEHSIWEYTDPINDSLFYQLDAQILSSSRNLWPEQSPK